MKRKKCTANTQFGLWLSPAIALALCGIAAKMASSHLELKAEPINAWIFTFVRYIFRRRF